MSKVIRVRYEKGVFKPLDRVDAGEGEIFYVRILRRELAEEVFGSIRVDKRVLEAIMREAEGEFSIY